MKPERRIEVRHIGFDTQKELLPALLGVEGQTVKQVEALILIADGVADSDGYMYRLTGRTIHGKVPVTVCTGDGSNVVYHYMTGKRRAYCNCVGHASLELRGDKLYASLEILDNVKGRFQPVVESSGGEIEKDDNGLMSEPNCEMDPTILGIELAEVGTNSDDRIPEIEL